jgi:L-malate glycosyltransferase
MLHRIAIVASRIDIPGGQGVQAAALLRCLRESGRDVIFVVINPRFPRGLSFLHAVPYARTILNQVLYLPGLVRLRHADVVHVFAASYWSYLLGPVPAMLVARTLGKRVVLHYHSGEADHHLTGWGPLVHPWLRLAHKIVVPSDYLRQVFARHGYQTRVIPNVVDTSSFRYRERVPLRPWLVSTRNLEPYYALDNTIAAFAILRERYPGARLTIAGYGGEEARLRRLAAVLSPDAVQFVGRVEPAAMPALLDEVDIFVNSSVVDNQPVSVLEAFAAGLPVVSTGTGDLANMLRDGETGLIVPSRDPAAMAKAIISLFEDPDRAAMMARRARREVEKYTWAQVGTQWTAVYAGKPW